MSDDTEVTPLTAQQTKYLRCCVPDRGAGEALQAIRDGRHGTYDKATHAAVEHAELERLRGAVAALKAEMRDPERGVRSVGVRDNDYSRIAIDTIFQACSAIDAAQQEGSRDA